MIVLPNSNDLLKELLDMTLFFILEVYGYAFIAKMNNSKYFLEVHSWIASLFDIKCLKGMYVAGYINNFAAKQWMYFAYMVFVGNKSFMINGSIFINVFS